MLIFKHAVIYGGKYYPPNTPIKEHPKQPADTEQKATPARKKAKKAGDKA